MVALQATATVETEPTNGAPNAAPALMSAGPATWTSQFTCGQYRPQIGPRASLSAHSVCASGRTTFIKSHEGHSRIHR
jgi:hypothetical protein